jgi:hypothetical protein
MITMKTWENYLELPLIQSPFNNKILPIDEREMTFYYGKNKDNLIKIDRPKWFIGVISWTNDNSI